MKNSTRIILAILDCIIIGIMMGLWQIRGFDPLYVIGSLCGIISLVLSVYMMINEGNGD